MTNYPCQISEWLGAPPIETGAPMPNLLVDESRLYLGYRVRFGHNAEGWTYAVVLFTGVRQHTFGYPNDEALGGHPLYSAGLSYYAFNEVADSPYLKELAVRNARVFPASVSTLLMSKHWIVTFHDETLEIVGDAVRVIGTTRARSSLEAISNLRAEAMP